MVVGKTENKTLTGMNGDVRNVKTGVESVISTKTGHLKESLDGLVSKCAEETNVREESDTMKVLPSGIDMRFRDEHAALVEAINAHTAVMNAQTGLLEVLCNEVNSVNEKVGSLLTYCTS